MPDFEFRYCIPPKHPDPDIDDTEEWMYRRRTLCTSHTIVVTDAESVEEAIEIVKDNLGRPPGEVERCSNRTCLNRRPRLLRLEEVPLDQPAAVH